MEVLKIINPDNIEEKEALQFPKREAARAIVFNKDRNKIGMQYAENDKYHKLPGGGIEPGEDVRKALERECEEELGFDIEIEKEIGSTIEYRKTDKERLYQTSYHFFAHVINEQHPLNLDPGEIKAGFIVEWLTIDEAIKALEKEITEVSYHRNNKYILPRDLFILKYIKSR